MAQSEQSKTARRELWGKPCNLNYIPVAVAYDFELRWIAENSAADGFHGSPQRVAEAKAELLRRG